MGGSRKRRRHSRVAVVEFDVMALQPEPESQVPKWFNISSCGCVGCHIADEDAPWILGYTPGVPLLPSRPQGVSTHSLMLARGGDDLVIRGDDASLRRRSNPTAVGDRMIASSPVRLSVDALTGTISVTNHSRHGPQVVYVTATCPGHGTNKQREEQERQALQFSGRNGVPLQLGTTRRDAESRWQTALTFVVTAPALTELQLAALQLVEGAVTRITTFVFPLLPHPTALVSKAKVIPSGVPPAAAILLPHWPMGGADLDQPRLCTQGVGGRLTHVCQLFSPSLRHAAL